MATRKTTPKTTRTRKAPVKRVPKKPEAPSPLVALAICKAMGDQVKEVSDVAKKDVLGMFNPGDRVHARVADYDLATVSVSEGRDSYRVTNGDKFMEWVRENKPAAIIETVSDIAVKQILQEINVTGEVPDGVELKEGQPYVSVRMSEAQLAQMRAAYDAGQITFEQVLAIETGEAA